MAAVGHLLILLHQTFTFSICLLKRWRKLLYLVYLLLLFYFKYFYFVFIIILSVYCIIFFMGCLSAIEKVNVVQHRLPESVYAVNGSMN